MKQQSNTVTYKIIFRLLLYPNLAVPVLHTNYFLSTSFLLILWTYYYEPFQAADSSDASNSVPFEKSGCNSWREPLLVGKQLLASLGQWFLDHECLEDFEKWIPPNSIQSKLVREDQEKVLKGKELYQRAVNSLESTAWNIKWYWENWGNKSW